MQKLNSKSAAGLAGDKNLSAAEVEQVIGSSSDASEDKVLARFKATIRHSPDQVLRYSRGGQPLWVASEGAAQECHIPLCENCGGKRIFEFQILPQLLLHLDLEEKMGEAGVDWGTLAVYACEKSCDVEGSRAYKQEFLYRQRT